jgi:hypothetical protein
MQVVGIKPRRRFIPTEIVREWAAHRCWVGFFDECWQEDLHTPTVWMNENMPEDRPIDSIGDRGKNSCD